MAGADAPDVFDCRSRASSWLPERNTPENSAKSAKNGSLVAPVKRAPAMLARENEMHDASIITIRFDLTYALAL